MAVVMLYGNRESSLCLLPANANDLRQEIFLRKQFVAIESKK